MVLFSFPSCYIFVTRDELGYHLHNIFLSLLHRQAEAFLFHLVVHLAWRLNHVLSVET